MGRKAKIKAIRRDINSQIKAGVIKSHQEADLVYELAKELAQPLTEAQLNVTLGLLRNRINFTQD